MGKKKKLCKPNKSDIIVLAVVTVLFVVAVLSLVSVGSNWVLYFPFGVLYAMIVYATLWYIPNDDIKYSHTIQVHINDGEDIPTALRQLADCIEEEDYIGLMEQNIVTGLINNPKWDAYITKYVKHKPYKSQNN